MAGKNNRVKKESKKVCELCKNGIPHMTVVKNQIGDIHVHAPFGDKQLMKDFMDAIHTEQDRWSIDHEITKIGD